MRTPIAPPLCPTSGKRTYFSRVDAQSALSTIKEKHSNNVSVGSHRCPDCSCWHLTHRTDPPDANRLPKALDGLAAAFNGRRIQ